MSYSNGLLSDQSYQTANKYVQRGLPGVGFKLTVMGDYDMQNKKLTNVKSGTDSNDAVNKSQLDATTNLLHGSRAGDVVNDKAVIYSNTGAVHANSLYIEDPPNQGNSNEVRIMTEHQSYPNIHLNIPDLHNFDGHGGRPKSELMVTSVEQTVTGKKVFENIEVHDPTSNNQAANKSYADTKLSLTGGTMTGDLILPHHNYPIPGNTNKVINYESQREIFLSRQESFPMHADINMNNNFIQNIATPTSSHQVTNKGYCDYNFLNRQKGGVLMGPLSMNRNDLTGIPDTPKFGYSAVNKNYVDGEISKIPGTDTSPFLKIDGSRAMTGNLDMGDHSIQKVGDPVNSDDVATKNYVDADIGYISTPFLKLDGTRAMTGVLNMNDQKISNLKMPEFNTDAANKQYIDNTLAESHLTSSHKSNEFKYLNDPNETSSEYNITVDAFTDFNESPHKNKKAFQITLTKDVGTNDYRSRMGFNLYPLPLGTYTIIFEYYFPENTNIQLSCQSTTAYVHKQIQKDFTDYSKLLVQINNNSKTTPDYLFFTIHGTAVVSNPEGYIIVYGVKDWSDSVDPNIYDDGFYVQMFQYKNGDMQIQTDIDMNTHKIKNLSDATNTKDAINKGQLDAYKALNDEIFTNNNSKMKILTELDMDNNKIINLKNAVNKNDVINKGQLDEFKNEFERYRFYIKNHSFLDIFSYLVFDFNEPGKFIVKFFNLDSYIDGIASNESPTINISSTLNKRISYNNFKPKKGIQFSSSHRLIMELDYNVDEHSSYTMLIIMTLKDNLKISFIEPTQGLISYYPVYIINKVRRILSIQTSNTDYIHGNPLPLVVSDQQIMIWIQHKAAPPPYSAQSVSKLTITGSRHGTTYSYLIPTSYFSTNKLRIETGNNIINKICYQHQHIEYSIQNPDYVRLLFEEMKNGTLVDLSQ